VYTVLLSRKRLLDVCFEMKEQNNALNQTNITWRFHSNPVLIFMQQQYSIREVTNLFAKDLTNKMTI